MLILPLSQCHNVVAICPHAYRLHWRARTARAGNADATTQPDADVDGPVDGAGIYAGDAAGASANKQHESTAGKSGNTQRGQSACESAA